MLAMAKAWQSGDSGLVRAKPGTSVYAVVDPLFDISISLSFYAI